MTPQEKAKQLFCKYYRIPLYIKVVKECCLIDINNQIELYNNLNSLGLLKDNSVGFELYEIKKEIEKL